MKSTFLATVNKDFEVTEDFKQQLEKKGIELLNYHKNLNILKLASDKDISSLKMQPITHIEKDKDMKALEDKSSSELS